MINFRNICLATLVASSFCTMSSEAFAGEGGIAASASFTFDGGGGNVTAVSTAVAVGKSGAYAGAKTSQLDTGFVTEAFAGGSGGVITIGESLYITSLGEDTDLGTAQGNTLSSDSVNIDATGTGVTVGDTPIR